MAEPLGYDRETGEVIDAHRVDGEHVAGGCPMPRKAVTIADTIRLLNDGQFDADASAELRELIKKMEAYGFLNKGVAKGKLVLTLDIALANGAHVVVPSIKVTAPVPKVAGTLLFAHEDGGLSRNPPGQGAFFGLKSVEDKRDIRG